MDPRLRGDDDLFWTLYFFTASLRRPPTNHRTHRLRLLRVLRVARQWRALRG